MKSSKQQNGSSPSTQDAIGAPSDHAATELNMNPSLEGLQTDEQRHVLDVVAQLRKCGLESVLSLPQLVVCGDQSAGKSSVLEALTEIPFPRADNLCTRFATEIILRRGTTDSLTIKVIPDPKRPAGEQSSICAFTESITDLGELPRVMAMAMVIMGIDNSPSGTQTRAFAKDTLSVEIEGPSRPQLTLVDLPGLIQTQTKGVTKADVNLVTEITDHYVSQPRTICLAVVSATNDYANQGILTKVRAADPDGERTLGIITKPDRLSAGSGMEKSFLALASNEDIFFKLGWHMLKNRSFEEGSCSFVERNMSEAAYFRKSVFKTLPQECVGIDALRDRLSHLLFAHVKQELPQLRDDLERALTESTHQLSVMGKRRATPQECRTYLAELSLDYHEVCKAAVGGHYEGNYFNSSTDEVFKPDSPGTIRRLRAVIQYLNTQFSEELRQRGHKYHIERPTNANKATRKNKGAGPDLAESDALKTRYPIKMSGPKALEWVGQATIRTRGRELQGNFNPLLIGELFWEQSSNWHRLALEHLERVASICSQFLAALLQDMCPKDVRSRLWSYQIQQALKARSEASIQELDLIVKDIKSYPINYNHDYTDTIKKNRQARAKNSLSECIEAATERKILPGCNSIHESATIDVNKVVERYSEKVDPDMQKHSSEEALDCMFSIYEVSQKTFVANVTTQVVERHIVRGLEKIFSPVVVTHLSDADAAVIASEPVSAKRQRDFWEDRIAKLKGGHMILRDVLAVASM